MNPNVKNPPFNPRAFSIGLAAAAVILSLGACSKPEPAAKVEVPRPVLIQIAKTASGVGADGFSLPAETRARVESRYGFRVPGKLSQRLVTVGDSVAAGQVIARLDPQDAAPAIATQQAQLAGAKTELVLAQADLVRTKDLRDKNFVSQAQLDRQSAVVDGAQSKLKAVEAQLKQAQNGADFQVLRADKAGVVLSVDAEVGQVVAAGQSIYRVAQAGDRDLVVNVPETSLRLVRATQSWAALIPALGNQPVSATFRELSPVADPASRTYVMKLTVDGVSNVPLGATAIVRPTGASTVSGGDATQFLMPLSVLYSKDGKPNVWVVDSGANGKEGVVRLVSVTTAGFTDDGVRIVSGIKAGDKVVIAGANLLNPGQKVKLP
jgi:membrane fusion protein, multidrug efflux system